MDQQQWITLRIFGIIALLSPLSEACIFYSKLGQDSEAEGVRFIRVREDLHVGGDILTLRAYPRNRVKIKGIERSQDYKFFGLTELNDTHIQVKLDKSIDDLVDRDVPQNLLKFKIECSSREGRNEETSFLAVTVYIEDINDHWPLFQNVPYAVNVDESTPVGTTIFQGISAFDRDKPNTPNSDVQFSLGADNLPGGPYFALESPHRPSVVLRRLLDFDDGIRRFEVPVIASDRGSPPNKSNLTLTVTVDDHDDLPPRFTEGVYRTKINEFYPVTGLPIHVILKFGPPIIAYDQDSLNATLIYDIISGNERNLFSVNPANGIIYLNREIDLEEESLPGNTFVLQLEARQADSPLKRALARVEIEMIDLNDNAPEFEVDLYNISIVENLPSGFSVLQVTAIDRDQGENAEFYYHISAEKPNGAFVIDPRTGWITVRDQELLDREARSSITMTIQALEKLEPYNERDKDAGVVEVEVTLLDSNDNTPEFEMGNLYEFKINIDSPVGSVVGEITARDPDEGRNGMILYELQRPRGSGVVPFKLDSNSGKLVVSGPLRRGRVAVFVEASDQPANPSERRFSLAVVTVEVYAHISNGAIDFVGAPYEFWVGADVPVGSSVGQIRTNIEFDEVDGEVMYDLLHSYAEGVPFAVEERSGIVTVIRDFEQFDRNYYEFEAVATHESYEKPYGQLVRRISKSERQITSNGEVFEIDEGIISDSQNVLVTNVTIHIVNPDDERGILMRGTYADPIEFHIKENVAGALIGQLLYKNFTRPNSNEQRALSNTAVPSVNQTNRTKGGKEMFSAKNLRKDRQLNSKYSRNSTFRPALKAARKNRDTNLDTAFFVSVTPTVFYDDSLAEESLATAESGVALTYAEPVRRPFKPKVKETDTKKQILYERKTTYDSHMNNNEPVNFETFQSTKDVRPIQDDVLPQEETQTNNGSSTEASIVHKQHTEIPLEVIITPRPTLRIPKQTNLFVVRQNQTKPVRSEKRSYSGDPSGLRFLIANQQDVTDMIAITNDGTLMTVKGLDREVRDTYRLTVIAEYSKGYVNGAGIYQVTIYVDDVNDNAPAFNHKSYSGMIAENSPSGSDVYVNQQMLIKDADAGENAIFSVTIAGEGSNMFSVNLVTASKTNATAKATWPKRNAVRNAASMLIMDTQTFLNVSHYVVRFVGSNTLDREQKANYELKLLAKDKGGLSSEVRLNIFVTDINDNAPMFEQIAVLKDIGIDILEFTNDLEIYFVDRMDDEERLVVTSTKTPPDQVAHGLSKESSPPTKISDRIGTPRQLNSNYATLVRGPVASALRRTRKSKLYEIPQPYFSILESVPIGKTVFRVLATDDDEDENAQVFYDIETEALIPAKVTTSRSAHNFFSIDRLSGEIKIVRPLLAESEIRMNISAKDIGGLADYAIVKVKVIDINDHAPVFEKSWYTFDLNEGVYTNNVLGKIIATDEDYGENANISYTIQTDQPVPFFITPHSGILKVNGELDRESLSRYEFKIVAFDSYDVQTQLTAMVEVEVNVLDLNDNAPEFIGYDEIFYARTLNDIENLSRKLSDVQSLDNSDDYEQPQTIPVYQAYLNKNTEPGTFVKEIKAIDKDFAGNGNGLVMYALQHSQMPYFFEIDSREGIIMTVAKFTRVHGYEHVNVTIVASDLGSPSKSSTALLLVNLQGDDLYEDDEEEEQRLFPNKYYEIEVEENSDVPMELIQIEVAAAYRDEAFKWSLVPEIDVMEYNEFSIDSRNGSLWLVKSLDREAKDSYQIKIRADRQQREGRNMLPNIVYPVGGERLQGLHDNELRVIIKVTDVNDNAPKFVGNGKPIISVMPNMANFGFPVTKVHAVDLDAGVNGDVRYSLLNEPSKLFGIDAISGRIRVLGPVRGDQRVYGFDVKATDRRGADDGHSAITNVFVYVLDENRQVRLVLAGKPEEVEQDIENLTKSLSEATELDVRVRMLEPHYTDDKGEPATDVYLYAVDPRSNSIVDMGELQSTMSTLSVQNLTISSQIIELAQLGDHSPSLRPNTTQNTAAIKTPELASIILAVIVFAGSLATALCVVCVRYKRRRCRTRNAALAYSISGAPSSVRTISKSSGSTKRMLPSARPTASQLYQETVKERSGERSREYIDVPLPQSVLTSNFTMEQHDSGCLRYNQIHNAPQTMNLDNSVTSLHSSGRDSGLDLTRERSDSPSKQIVRIIRSGGGEPQQHVRGVASRRKKCSCGHAEQHGCSGGEESSDSYEDSLKNSKVCRRTSLPKVQSFRRSIRVNPVGHRGIRHSFSGIRDDLVQASPALLGSTARQSVTRTSFSDLEERLRNLERSFREPFHLKNSNPRC